MNNDLISRSALLEKAEYTDNYRLIVPVDCIEKAPAVDAETVIKSLPYVKEALEMAKQTVEPVVRCENCTHQQKVWHDDKRMKEDGFFIYSCELNEDPFVAHVVDGNPGEFCSAGKRRTDK